MYPTVNDAIFTNPATVMDESGATAGRLNYDPAAGYSALAAKASGSSGFGMALNSLGTAGIFTLGYGTGGDLFHIGANMSLLNSYNPGDATFGIGAMIGRQDGWRIAGYMTSVLEKESNVLTLGVGYAKSGVYQVEWDLTAPAAHLTDAGPIYTQRFTGIRYFNSFGIGIFEESKASIDPLSISSPDIGGKANFYVSGQTSLDFTYVPGDGGGLGFGFLTRL